MDAGDPSAPGGGDWKHLGLFADDAALRDMIDMESECDRPAGDVWAWGLCFVCWVRST